MADWLSSDVPWPVHPKPHWRRTLDEARSSGRWFLLKFEDHGWGKLACAPNPGSLDPEDVCTLLVDGTATGGETFARIALSKVASCPHRRDTPVDDPQQARQLVRDSNWLLDAAERLIAEQGHLIDSEGLLAEAVESPERMDEFFERAEWAETKAETAHDDAQRFVGAARYAGDVEAAALIDEAERQLEPAASLAPNDLEIAAALTQARARIEGLRGQLVRL